MHYAIIEHGKVQNVAVADSPIATNWVELPEGVWIGWGYDGSAFTPPVVQPVTPAPRSWNKEDYLKKFTQTERIAIRSAAKVNAVVEDYIELLNAATYINPDDPVTVAGVQALEAAGLLAVGRATEILA